MSLCVRIFMCQWETCYYCATLKWSCLMVISVCVDMRFYETSYTVGETFRSDKGILEKVSLKTCGRTVDCINTHDGFV